MHGVWLGCQISPEGHRDSIQFFLKSDFSLCCRSAWSSLASPGQGEPHQGCIQSAVSQRGREGQGQGGLKYLLTSPYSSPSFPSWILFDEKNFEGEQYVLSEGEFPTLTAMGCLASTVLGSLRKVPLVSAPVPGTPEAEVSLPLPTADGAVGLKSSLPQNYPRSS